MTCDVNDGVFAFPTLKTFGPCLPTESKDEQDGTGIVVVVMVAKLLGM